jgi:phospholipid/cholesterol/gamma-HCH transport system ATP-binding protein
VNSPKDTDAFLRLDKIVFGYAERKILDGVSMRFEKGSVTALMGGSGGGKTTVLRLIGGQQIPQQGSIVLDGQELTGLNRAGWFKVRKKMGMLFQHGALFTDLSVFDNVAFPLRENTDLSEDLIRTLVLMKLQAVGLRGAAQLMPSEISGGMARRVALARSVALDPPVIMYDEPFTGLDPISMGTIARLIRSLNDALGAISIVVTHDVSEAFEICDYAYLLAEGKISAQGTPDQLRATQDPFARQFFDGKLDGPVGFHYPAPSLEEAFGLAAIGAPQAPASGSVTSTSKTGASQ